MRERERERKGRALIGPVKLSTCVPFPLSPHSYTLKMEAEGAFETLLTIIKSTTQGHMPENSLHCKKY
jgi:hypothetical protein